MNNDVLLKKLVRQLRFLNIMIAVFGVVSLLGIVVIGFLLFQVITFAQNAGQQLQDIRSQTTQQLNVRDQACRDGSLGAFLKNNTTVCQ